MEIVRQHPGVGARVLRSLAGLEDVAEVVVSAKEWYDGSGYPEALQGEAIPLDPTVVDALLNMLGDSAAKQ